MVYYAKKKSISSPFHSKRLQMLILVIYVLGVHSKEDSD